ncbi:hypothetical protein DXG01_004843 [Tephrocybe rancida]|nr:hypothetical protein DXG01_004843 [Tephrocybe rancida]
MSYAQTQPLPVHSPGRAGHRRSYIASAMEGPSFGALPRRPSSKFHFQDTPESSDDESSDAPSPFFHVHPPMLRLKLKQRPSSSASFGPVPRPPPIARTNSTPILLSNGKPLKSSLKGSSSSPSISPSSSQPSPLSSSPRARAASTPVSPKNVHFPHTLATVRLFSRSARPASLSSPIPDDTDTDGDPSDPSSFPFPRLPSSSSSGPSTRHTIDTARCSPIPSSAPPATANVHLESIQMGEGSLRGTLLVRNVSYEKRVAVRFTLDGWDTTSEVSAAYVSSLPALPPALHVPGSGLHAPPSPSPSTDTHTASKNEVPPAWDRFSFSLPLPPSSATPLSARTLFLVARFSTPAAEWWDNNAGSNYRVCFCRTSSSPRFRVPAYPSPGPAASPTPHAPPTPIVRAPRAAPSRLRALSLKNYAAPALSMPPLPLLHAHAHAPSTSPSASSSPPTPYPLHIHAQRSRTPSLSSAEASPLATPTDLAPLHAFPPLSAEKAKDKESPAGVGLYWPWSRMSPTQEEEEDGQTEGVRSASITPMPVPTPPRQEGDRNKDKEEGEERSDEAYQALVRKWCFAGPPGVVH